MKLIQRILFLTLFLVGCTAPLYALRKPRLTIIFVIDQGAYSYFPKLLPHMRGGIKHLAQHGIFYKNAYYPHAILSTAPGHAGLNTGTYPKDHGAIANNWYNDLGEKIVVDHDTAESAAVFSPTGVYPYGKSARNLMVDGISDQFALASEPCEPHTTIALSLKARSAIMSAGQLGKAVWFDTASGRFTSSKAYFDQLPAWLTTFNSQQAIYNKKSIRWPLLHGCNKAPYCFRDINNYQFSCQENIAGKTIPMHSAKKPYGLFMQTPAANQLLLDLALRIITTHITRCGAEELLLWVCLSPLDMIGHDFGPQSLEAIDMLYHLDCQIQTFMYQVQKRLKRRDILYVLTADHGVSPIPELLQAQGLHSARRILSSTLTDTLNAAINQKYGLENVVIDSNAMQLYVKTNALTSLAPEVRSSLMKDIAHVAGQQPGIKRVWSYDELQSTWFLPDQIESFYKNQTYPGRSAPFIIQPFPYNFITQHTKGSTHRTPYESDRHVPLILYQKSNLEKQVIYDHVWTLQLANTLAHILNVQKPSASTFDILPGVISYDPLTGEVLETVSSPCPCA